MTSINSAQVRLPPPVLLKTYGWQTIAGKSIPRWCSATSLPRSVRREVHDESASNDISAFDNAEQVQRALDQLPILQREALTLYFLEDLSFDEMAAILELPLGTVKSRIHYEDRSA